MSLNTVFDEQGYLLFKEQIEEAIQYFRLRGTEPTLKEVNKFLADNIWNEIGIEGIIFDDKPTNQKKGGRVYSSIPRLYYKKRIQIVLFKLDNVHRFTQYLTNQK